MNNQVNTLRAVERIKVEGYRGFWSVIDEYEQYVLLEHNTYGDETCYLVVDANQFSWKDISLKSGITIRAPFFASGSSVFETYDDIATALEDEGII